MGSIFYLAMIRSLDFGSYKINYNIFITRFDKLANFIN